MPVTRLVAPGPEVAIATPTLPAGARISIRHVRAALLMAHQHMMDRVTQHRIVDRQFAPPGYPKTTSTPSRTRHSHIICAPFFSFSSPSKILNCSSCAACQRLTLQLTCQNRARIGAGDKMRIALQPLAVVSRFERRQRCQPALDLLVAQADIERARFQIDLDHIARLQRGDRPARRRFRRDVPDARAARPAAKSVRR